MRQAVQVVQVVLVEGLAGKRVQWRRGCCYQWGRKTNHQSTL